MAADVKLSQLTEATGIPLDAGDLLPFTDVSDTSESATGKTKRLAAASLFPLRNAIINGGFGIWQRGTSFTATGYTSDRWRVALGSGAAITTSQQSHTLGQTDVPGEPTYFLRFNRTTTGSGDSTIEQRIESVRSFAGQQVTVSFYAKASAALSLQAKFTQNFGTGGSPSGSVDTTISSGYSVTTSWQRFVTTVSVPSISGKTLGSGNNDFLSLVFTLPTSEGTKSVDISNVQVERGPVATSFELRPVQTEVALCQRYYFRRTNSGNNGMISPIQAYSSGGIFGMIILPGTMRTAPTCATSGASDFHAITSGGGATGNFTTVDAFSAHGNDRIQVQMSGSSGLTAGDCTSLVGSNSTGWFEADAEL